MGVDVYFCVRKGGRWVAGEPAERVASIDGFLNMAYMFGLMLEPLRNLVPQMSRMPNELDVAGAMARFEDYLAEEREDAIARFQGYYGFIAESHRRMKELAGEGEAVMAGNVIEQLTLDDFEPDAQVFFGRFMLSSHAIEPDEAGIVAPALGMILALLAQFAERYRQENPTLADNLLAARACLDVARRFCDEAIHKNLAFNFDC